MKWNCTNTHCSASIFTMNDKKQLLYWEAISDYNHEGNNEQKIKSLILK